MAWTADLTNDPDKGYALCIDLWEGEEHRGRIERDATGELALRVYGETAGRSHLNLSNFDQMGWRFADSGVL